MSQYVDKNDLKTYIGLSGSGQDTNIDNAINGASRQIDAICGRYFYQDDSVNAKPYTISSTSYNWPHTEIEILATRSSERFDKLIQKNIKVQAKFGWAAIPEAISQATLIQATRLFKRKDTPFNVFGSEATGQELFSKMDPDAKELIKGYIKRKL